jgi:hypothetical protein
MKKTIGYLYSVGLSVIVNERLVLAQVCFAIKDDDTVAVHIENARNCAQIKRAGSKVITREQLREAPEDAYDNIVFARWAFGLFGVSVES